MFAGRGINPLIGCLEMFEKKTGFTRKGQRKKQRWGSVVTLKETMRIK